MAGHFDGRTIERVPSHRVGDGVFPVEAVSRCLDTENGPLRTWGTARNGRRARTGVDVDASLRSPSGSSRARNRLVTVRRYGSQEVT
jgi:hypothetical protein